jgi:hypothetical protein
VDVIPLPFEDWKDREKFCVFAGMVLGVAATMGVKLRWGGDWDGDLNTREEKFSDMPHFEEVL